MANASLPELIVGWWPQMRARVRPLEPWEHPASGELSDDRMVVFAVGREGGMLGPDWQGLYLPGRTPEMLANFLRLFGRTRRPRTSQVIRHYARYGPLYLPPHDPTREAPEWAQRLSAPNREQLSREARVGLAEPVWWLQRRAQGLGRAYRLYRALAEDDMGLLRELLPAIRPGERLVRYGWQEEEIVAYLQQPAPSAEGEDPTGSAMTDDDYRHWGRLLLVDRLEEGEQGSRVRWLEVDEEEARQLDPEVLTGVPRLVRGRSFTSLVSAMHLQLAQMVSSGEQLRACEGCGGWYYSTHGAQRYCEPHCADAARRRALRKASRER